MQAQVVKERWWRGQTQVVEIWLSSSGGQIQVVRHWCLHMNGQIQAVSTLRLHERIIHQHTYINATEVQMIKTYIQGLPSRVFSTLRLHKRIIHHAAVLMHTNYR